MDKAEHIKYWIETAEEDMLAAESLLISKRYTWALFIGSLVVEKALKARFVVDNKDVFPPKTHDLVRLASLTKLSFTEAQIETLEEISDFNIEARYPDLKKSFHSICNQEFTENYFRKIKDLFSWIKSNLKY